MRLLIDTHLLLWWLSDVPALPGEARVLIADPENTVFLSAVTMWEVWLKESLGKLQLPADFEQRLATQAFERLPLSFAHAREVARLPWRHRDPFDRMLVAQASVEKLTLLTADDRVVSYGSAVRLVK